MKNPHLHCFATTFVFCGISFMQADAAHPWLTAKGTELETKPMSVYMKDNSYPLEIPNGFQILATQSNQKFIDIVISYHGSPRR